MEPEVIYDDKNFIAVNKPAGLLVHRAKFKAKNKLKIAEEPTLVERLIKKYPEIKTVGDDPEERPGIVHRLDKDTSGVMIVAKNQPYFEYLKNLFQSRTIKKTYLAVVWGTLKNRSGTIDKAIGIKSGTTKRSIHSEKFAKQAVTEYKVRKQLEDRALLEVSPLTGRTHQIRVHLASIGHPILGDKLYGRKNDSSARLMLHALAIELPLREGGLMRLEADTPLGFDI